MTRFLLNFIVPVILGALLGSLPVKGLAVGLLVGWGDRVTWSIFAAWVVVILLTVLFAAFMLTHPNYAS